MVGTQGLAQTARTLARAGPAAGGADCFFFFTAMAATFESHDILTKAGGQLARRQRRKLQPDSFDVI
jgi:hypothetical protein